jgi:YebC/PmpR family DNA-binding regulatory protein
MSGHSKWATIKRKKGDIDAKRGKIFTKAVREITTAARLGGGDIAGNPRLRAAVQAAKAARMPADNIERAIKKGTGDSDGPPVEETAYEGYGPGGVAVLIEAQTDNRNRTSSDVRVAFTKNDGNLGTTGSVAYLFRKVGQFRFDAAHYSEDQLINIGLNAGADDVRLEDDSIVVECEFKSFAPLMDALDAAKLAYESAELTCVPDTTIPVAGAHAEKVLRLIERLEDLDDVQKVYANFDIDEAEFERIANLSPNS